MLIRFLRRTGTYSWRLTITALLLLAAGCDAVNLPLPRPNLPGQAPTATPDAATPAGPEPSPTPLQPASSAAPLEGTPLAPAPTTEQPATGGELPSPPPTLPPSGGPQLAFLKDRDVWLLDQPTGQPYPLTVAGDILSFAWSPDGQRLVIFNGRSLCFFHSDGSIRTACLELGLNDIQSQVPRHILWSPDQRRIVLWNSINPWDEGAIGWLIVGLDTANEMFRIEDPVDWGASLAPNNEPGGFTGQPVFLPDGRLVGTLTHRYLCSEGGCHYQLYEFNFETKSLIPYPNKPQEGWSEGQRLVLSDDGQVLINFGTFFFGCDSFVTFVDAFDLASQSRKTYNLEGQAMADLALSPDMKTGVFARTAGCLSQGEIAWSQACGLYPGFEVYTMQLWEPASGALRDLPAGIEPDWSPDGQWIAFSSCLAQSSTGTWDPSADTPASIYMMDLNGNLTAISAGNAPAWRPR